MESVVEQPSTLRLEGFQTSPYWSEQIQSFRFEPGVSVHMNAPSVETFDPRKPTYLILFALPNGNTTAQTIGRKMVEGLDWHYDIQHIGAQVRRLREIMTDRNLVVVYLEADGRSWPSWRKKHPDSGERIVQMIETLRARIPVADARVILTGHSGGGSLTFGFLNAVEQIPDSVERIACLDSNYAYDTDSGHGAKLLAWLNGNPNRRLIIVCYDDREITLNGKKVLGPTGGTWRATHRMIDYFKTQTPIEESKDGNLVIDRALNGRVEFIMHTNPENKILHTVLVGPMNGLIRVVAHGTPFEAAAGPFGEPQTFDAWIQPDEVPAPAQPIVLNPESAASPATSDAAKP